MASHRKVYKTYVLYYKYVLIKNKMQIYQRVFLITLESSTATSFVSCLLVLSYDLFSLRRWEFHTTFACMERMESTSVEDSTSSFVEQRGRERHSFVTAAVQHLCCH